PDADPRLEPAQVESFRRVEARLAALRDAPELVDRDAPVDRAFDVPGADDLEDAAADADLPVLAGAARLPLADGDADRLRAAIAPAALEDVATAGLVGVRPERRADRAQGLREAGLRVVHDSLQQGIHEKVEQAACHRAASRGRSAPRRARQ